MVKSRSMNLMLGISLCLWAVAQANTLYPGDSNIVELTASNLDSHIYGSSKPWLVEFYAHWCGHCRAFAPDFRSLASDFRSWGTLNVGAVNCGDFSNFMACNKFHVTGYPTVYWIPAHSSSSSLGERYSGGHDFSSVSSFVRGKVGSPMRILHSMREFKSWGVGDSTIHAMSVASPASSQSKLMVLHDAQDEATENVVADVANTMSNQLSVASVPVTKESEALSSFDLSFEDLPAYFLLGRIHQSESASSPSSWVRFGDQVGTVPSRLLLEQEIFTTLGHISSSPFKDEIAEGVVETPTLHDIISAVRMALLNEVSMAVGSQQWVEKDKADSISTTLVEFLNMLANTFPLAHSRREFANLRDWVDEKQTNGYMDPMEWQQKVFEWTEGAFPSEYLEQKWIACEGSSMEYRGYTCGLWLTFHTAVVNSKVSEAWNTLFTMRKYVTDIFGCQTCREHFLGMSASLEEDATSRKRDAVLWLWNAHNKVNKRLSGDATEDPLHPKQQFPVAAQCSNCRHSDSDQWKKWKVYTFLKKHYTRNNDHTPWKSLPEEVNLQEFGGIVRHHETVFGQAPHASAASMTPFVGLVMAAIFAILQL